MSCDAPIRECLAWHYAPHFANVKIRKDGRSIQARCPLCNGSHALGISAGNHLRVIWNCFSHCDGADVRKAILTAGVPRACLPRGNGTEITTTEVIRMILTSGDKTNRAATILRAILVADGHTDWPGGKILQRTAAEAGISRTVAFDAKQTGPLLPPLTACYTPSKIGVVKPDEFSQASDVLSVANESGPPDQSGPPDYPKVRPTGLDSPPLHVEPELPKGHRTDGRRISGEMQSAIVMVHADHPDWSANTISYVLGGNPTADTVRRYMRIFGLERVPGPRVTDISEYRIRRTS